MRHIRTVCTGASVGGMIFAIMLGSGYLAVAEEDPPPMPPERTAGSQPHQLRLPPRADGTEPPEPNPEAVARHDAMAEASFALTPEEWERAKSILATDPAFKELLAGATYKVLGQGPWKAPDAPAIGAFFEIRFDQSFSKNEADLPYLKREREQGPLARDSFKSDLKNIEAMTVTVRFEEGAVVDVQPQTDDKNSTMTYPEGGIPTTDTGEGAQPRTGSGELRRDAR